MKCPNSGLGVFLGISVASSRIFFPQITRAKRQLIRKGNEEVSRGALEITRVTEVRRRRRLLAIYSFLGDYLTYAWVGRCARAFKP